MRWTAWTLGVGLALLAATSDPVAAAEQSGWESGWEYEVAPYGWIFGTFGTLDVRGRSASIDSTIGDTLELVFDGDALAAAGYFSMSHDRWSLFVDAFGGYAEESATAKIPTAFCTACLAATAEIRPVIVDAALGYRVGQWSLPGRRRPISLGVYAGTRYMHVGAQLRTQASVAGGLPHGDDVSQQFDWADPMIGLRWEVPVLDRVSLDFRGDIGGFGVSSQLIWGLVGGVRYWLTWTPWSVQPWLGVGYRVVAFDRDFGADGSLDMEFRGPISGLGFVF